MTQMEHTLDAYRHEQTRQLTLGQRWNGVRKVAAMFPGVANETLHMLHDGGRSISKFNSTKKLLTDEEEHVIVDFALQSSDCGFPCTHAFLGQQANTIRMETAMSLLGKIGWTGFSNVTMTGFRHIGATNWTQFAVRP